MSRPAYETTQDRDNERDVVGRAMHAWPGLVVTGMPKWYPVDFWGQRGDYGAAIEIKCRRYTLARIDAMGGLMIGLRKWSAAMALCQAGRVPFKVWLRTTDGGAHQYWTHSTTDFAHDGVAVTGRNDRYDSADMEPCVLLRAARFTSFEEAAR